MINFPRASLYLTSQSEKKKIKPTKQQNCILQKDRKVIENP